MLDREALGKIVRAEWVKCAEEQPNPKPSHLVPWEELDEANKEVDRRIGEAVAAAVRQEMQQETEADHELAEAVRAVTTPIPGKWGRWPDDKPPPNCKRCGSPTERQMRQGKEIPHSWQCTNSDCKRGLMTVEM